MCRWRDSTGNLIADALLEVACAAAAFWWQLEIHLRELKLQLRNVAVLSFRACIDCIKQCVGHILRLETGATGERCTTWVSDGLVASVATAGGVRRSPGDLQR